MADDGSAGRAGYPDAHSGGMRAGGEQPAAQVWQSGKVSDWPDESAAVPPRLTETVRCLTDWMWHRKAVSAGADRHTEKSRERGL